MEVSKLIMHLKHCANMGFSCISCDRREIKEVSFVGGTMGCMGDLMKKAADTIEALQAELREEMHRHDRLQDFEVAEAQQLAEIKAERDAMLAELKQDKGCAGCVRCDIEWDKEPCDSCRQDPKFPGWKWRGRP